ncbi:MAG: D-glycero-alpha-D-manno-heptose-1,7-bisphosphate 7-phosphatase [Candidatus Binatia bacterium]
MVHRAHTAVFVDRDGTLIRDVGYMCRQQQLEILPQVPGALRLLKRKGYKVVVITNQSAIARGHLTEDALAEIHRELFRRLARSGAEVDGVYYCPHHPTVGRAPYRILCDCRKPNTGMIIKAAAELDLAPSRSYVVGDQRIDMELAERSGAKGVWIQESSKALIEIPPGVTHVAANLWEAARWFGSIDGS